MAAIGFRFLVILMASYLTLAWIECGLPVFLPLLQFVEVVLQDLAITYRLYLAVMYRLYLAVQVDVVWEVSGDGVDLL